MRHVDDVGLVLPALQKGWYWNGENFCFFTEEEEDDIIQITKAMCSMVKFLQFTREDGTMFVDGKLPTVDTALWVENGKAKHSFDEKSTV